jgi:hypothetical protein
MNDVIIYDIETMQECFIVVCMKPESTPKSFTVSKWQNQLDMLRLLNGYLETMTIGMIVQD